MWAGGDETSSTSCGACISDDVTVTVEKARSVAWVLTETEG